MKKKILYCILCGILLIGITGCGTSENDIKEDDTKINSKTENNSISQKKDYYQTYYLLALNDGRKATITFSENGKCSVDFSEFNNRSKGVSNYISVTYSNGICTYQTFDDINFTINDTGTLELSSHWYHDYYKKMQTTSMGKAYPFKNVQIAFNEDYSNFSLTNGEWESVTGEVFYYYFKENGTEEKNIDNQDNVDNSNVNSSVSDSVYDSSNNDTDNNSYDSVSSYEKEQKEQEEKKKNMANEALQSTDLVISTFADVYSVKLSKFMYGPYEVLIDGKTYNYNYADTIQTFNYEKNGENCFEATIIDDYKNSKTANYCFTVQLETPKIEFYQNGLASEKCTLTISNIGNASYNNPSQITCTIDGEEKKCTNYFYVDIGTHVFNFKNKYGLTTEKVFECVSDYN